MKNTTFKNVWSPNFDKTIIIGTNKKNERWFFRVDSRHAAMKIGKAIMKNHAQERQGQPHRLDTIRRVARTTLHET